MKVKKPAPLLTSILSFTMLTGTIANVQSQLIASLPESLGGLAVSDASAKSSPKPDFSCTDVRVGLQIGHWNNQNPPAELAWISRNTGATGGGLMEWQSNMLIAQEGKEILESHGIKVDLLEAVVPPNYLADVFVSIHADGSENKNKGGYKVAGPARDYTGRSHELTEALRLSYGEVTGMEHDSANITSNMTQYYSYSSQNFEHSISSATPAALLETGFLSSPKDQQYLIHQPEVPGQGLAQGIIAYLAQQPDIEKC